MPEPSPRFTSLDPRLEVQMQALSDSAKQDGRYVLLGTSAPGWYMPVKYGWSGDVLDMQSMSDPFSRQAIEEKFDAAVSDAQQPGTVGDCILAELQGSWLASLERAFRSRHRTSVRNKIHAAARRLAHGEDSGVIQLGQRDYLQRLLKYSTGND